MPHISPSRVFTVCLGAWLLAAQAATWAQRPAATREDAANLRAKVDEITRHADAGTSAPLVTRITEDEVNAYLAFDAGKAIPVGLTEPHLSLLGGGRLSGTAVVDLDAVRASRKSRGLLDPLNYLGGRLAVSVRGTLRATDGAARVELEAANLGGLPVPKAVVQELLAFYSRTEERPRGLSLDDPYPLPARIRQIEVRQGDALVKQ